MAAARRLAQGDPALPDQQGFFCQQVAEKYLKAFLIAFDQVPPRTHDVDVLVEMCVALDPAFDQLQSVVEGLTEFAVIFRYPEEWSDEMTAIQSLVKAEQIRTVVRRKLGIAEE
ncbi:MAG: HEPN domain-containing protein [Anaerolineae bacterium]|nr:HEPN domain-containing protein [Anaerolineae bacterium]